MHTCLKGLGTIIISIAGVAVLASCGKTLSTVQSRVKDATGAASLTFDQWCDAWTLDCGAVKAELPPGAPTLSSSQWRSLLAVGKGVLDSPSHVVFSRVDLDSPALAGLSDALGVSKQWAEAKSRLDAMGFTGVTIGQGAVQMTSSGAADRAGQSKLIFHTEPQVTLAVSDELNVATTGIALFGPNGKSATFSKMSFGDHQTVALASSSQQVSGVPLAFMTSEALGLTGLAGGKKPVFNELLPLLVPLSDWLKSGHARDIDLGKAQLTVLADKLPDLITDEQKRATISLILSRLEHIESTTASRADHLIDLLASQDISCDTGKGVALGLSSKFAILAVSAADGSDDAVVSITFEGLSVSIQGPIPLPVSISRIDLAPNKIIIRDLPIIGSYSVDIDPTKTDLPKVELTCS